MASAFLSVSAKFVAYLAFVGGLGMLCIKISGFAGEAALVLAAPHLTVANKKPAITLVERRRRALEHRQVAQKAPAPVVPDPIVPSVPLTELASAMDLAEQLDLALSPQQKEPRRIRRTKARPAVARVAAADVFGRSFGVLVRAR